jgi:hypothetical protein
VVYIQFFMLQFVGCVFTKRNCETSREQINYKTTLEGLILEFVTKKFLVDIIGLLLSGTKRCDITIQMRESIFENDN